MAYIFVKPEIVKIFNSFASAAAETAVGLQAATPIEVGAVNSMNAVRRQTCLTALVERKGVFGALANRVSAAPWIERT
jgi:hypothetical protein